MKKTILFLIVSGGVCTDIQAQQTSSVPTVIQAQTALNKVGNVGPSGSMMGIAPPPKQLIGSTYLDDDWQKGTVLLYKKDARIEGYLLKYDIEADQLEIFETAASTKALEGVRIKSFELFADSLHAPRHFLNARAYKNEGVFLTGFFEVLVDGPLPLFRKIDVVIQKANYVKEFDTGRRDDKILQKETFYYAEQNNATKVPRKKLSAIFKDHSQEMEKFINDNDLNTKDAGDLQRIFSRYNLLAKE